MREDLRDLSSYHEQHYEKWTLLYSNLMQKSKGALGFCGKSTNGYYDSKYDEWRFDPFTQGICGLSDRDHNCFCCCENCWDEGEGGKKNKN